MSRTHPTGLTQLKRFNKSWLGWGKRRKIYPEVRSYECFKWLHLGMMSEVKRKTLPAIAKEFILVIDETGDRKKGKTTDYVDRPMIFGCLLAPWLLVFPIAPLKQGFLTLITLINQFNVYVPDKYSKPFNTFMVTSVLQSSAFSDRIVWRFIPLMVASGKLQMAIDAWLLQQHLQGNHPPTLRFYRFDPVAISLGFLQRTYPPHWDTLQWQGQTIERVYRPTGGRAVLHCRDLCYSVITSNLKGKRSEIYQQLCEFLIQGWQTLGVDLYYGKAGRGYIHNASCFGTATNADLVDIQGNKLIGSALRCTGKGVLQQGSMQFNPDSSLFEAVFGEAAPKTPFSGCVQDPVFLETVMTSLTAAACRCFNIELLSQPLSSDELCQIQSS